MMQVSDTLGDIRSAWRAGLPMRKDGCKRNGISAYWAHRKTKQAAPGALAHSLHEKVSA